MSVSAFIIPFLGAKLLEHYKSQTGVPDIASKILDLPNLISQLTKLNVAGQLSSVAGKLVSGADGADAISSDTITATIDAIKAFQNDRKLTVDGILGPVTAKILDTLRICKDPAPPIPGVASKTPPRAVNLSDFANIQPGQRVNPFEVRIFYESLPIVLAPGGPISRQRTIDIFQSAWNEWMFASNLGIVTVDSSEAADVVVKSGFVDGAGGAELANADIGPPDQLQLTIVFDQDERFSVDGAGNSSIFKAVSLHEIGHLLGLRHVDAETGIPSPPGQVMHAMYQGLLTLSDADKARIQKIFGAPQSSGVDEV